MLTLSFEQLNSRAVKSQKHRFKAISPTSFDQKPRGVGENLNICPLDVEQTLHLRRQGDIQLYDILPDVPRTHVPNRNECLTAEAGLLKPSSFHSIRAMTVGHSGWVVNAVWDCCEPWRAAGKLQYRFAKLRFVSLIECRGEPISIPKESWFRFFSLFWPFFWNWNRNQSHKELEKNQKRNSFTIHNSSFHRQAKKFQFTVPDFEESAHL